jgi:hypothetical protein
MEEEGRKGERQLSIVQTDRIGAAIDAHLYNHNPPMQEPTPAIPPPLNRLVHVPHGVAEWRSKHGR